MQQAPAADQSGIRRHLKQQLALQTLEEIGMLMREGHFDYGNGFHGTVYIHAHQLLHKPFRLTQLAQELLDLVPSTVIAEAEVVAGPESGGSILAYLVATFLATNKPIGKHDEIGYVRIGHRGEEFTLSNFYRSKLKGKKVVIADDVRNTGMTQLKCANLIAEAGGEVLATVEIFDRRSAMFTPKNNSGDVPNFFLAEYDTRKDTFPEKDCPLCRLHVPIKRF